MANFLFPCSSSHKHPKMSNNYHTVLSDIARGASDSIDALTAFQRLLLLRDYDLGVDLGLATLDAHCSDSGCHVRACMLLDASYSYQQMRARGTRIFSAFCTSLNRAVRKVRDVEMKARGAYHQLVHVGRRPEELQLPSKRGSPREILFELGWREEFTEESSAGASILHVPSPTKWVWDVTNLPTMVRFIVFSFTLSKYKTFSYDGKRTIGTVKPCSAVGLVDSLDTSRTKNKTTYKKPGINRLEREFREMKVWLSSLTTAWLLSRSRNIMQFPGFYDLLSRTIQISPKGIQTLPCYLGYLVVREFLAGASMPVIFVNRHFCESGYHLNIYMGFIPRKDNQQQEPGRETRSVAAWSLERANVIKLQSCEAKDPHIVFIGNSVSGTSFDYSALMISSTHEPRPLRTLPHESACASNEEHESLFLAADHDEILLSYFAAHRSYPFQVASRKITFVEDCISSWANERNQCEAADTLCQNWYNMAQDANRDGGGQPYNRPFMLQHVLSEIPSILGHLLARAHSKADLYPVVARYGAKDPDHTPYDMMGSTNVV